MASIIDSLIDSILSSNGKTNTDCKIYLSCAGEELLLPVPPAKFEITRAYNNSRITINKIGEINMLGKKGLKTLSITSIFPNQRYTFCICEPNSPYDYVDKINTFAVSGEAANIRITGSDVNFPASIDNFSYGEDDGTGDVFYKIDMTEYIYLADTALTDKVAAATGLKGREDIAEKTKEITVYPGDSPMDIASRAIGEHITLDDKNLNYLKLYKELSKKDLSAGEVLKITGQKVKVGDTIVNF